MGSLRREVGFWKSVGRLHLSDLVTPEIGGGALLGAGAAVLLVGLADVKTRVVVAGDYLTLTPALLGVVFASLALVVALMSDDYLRQLNDAKGGLLDFLSPFMLVIGLQVGTLVGTVGFRAFAERMPTTAGNWAFGVVTVLFVISTLEVISLGRNVLMHGLARGRLQEITDLGSERERKRRSV